MLWESFGEGCMYRLYLKILIIFASFVCFANYSFAQQAENYLEIPDFIIHKVTPVKTEDSAPVKSDNKASKENKQLPKLRIDVKPEKVQTEKVAEKQPETKPAKTETELPKVQPQKENNITEEKSIITNTQTEIKEPEKNNEEIVSKVNKIIETDALSKNSSLKENLPIKSSESLFLKTFSSLAIVLFLIFIFAWVYARLKGINPAAVLTGRFNEKDLNNFNVLTSSTLGQGKDIHLVEINGKQLVIGSTSSNINLLTEITPEEIEEFKTKKQQVKTEEKPEENNEGFKEVLEEELYYQPEEEIDDIFEDSDYYSLTHTEVYKEYIKEEDDSVD